MNWFLLLLITGTILSWVARVLLEDLVTGSGVAVLICLVCLFTYYIVVKRDNTELHNPDNCYYMGLLFTLVALIYSLITLFLLDDHAGAVAERTYNLIGSFGIALISTFAGILFRILLLQKSGPTERFDKPPDIPESGKADPANTPWLDQRLDLLRLQAHADLTETAFNLRRELTQTIADMSVFRGAIIQAADETVQELGKAHAAIIQQVEKIADEQIRTLSSVSPTVTEIFEEIVASAQEMSKARAAIIQQAEKAADEQAEILSTLSTTTVGKLAEVVDGITASVTNTKKSLDDLAASQVEQMRNSSVKFSEAEKRLSASIASVQEPLQGIVHNLQSTNNHAQTVVSNYDLLNSRLQQSITSFTKIENTMEQSTMALTTATGELSQSLVKTTEVTPQYVRQFEEAITSLRHEVEQWQTMTREAKVVHDNGGS